MNDTQETLVSVVLCAYNTPQEVLAATLQSLRTQDLPFAQWELIVIDNNSQPSLATYCEINWHPNARLVVEKAQGLAHARRRGYQESRSRLIIHSDDDNLLDPDYLSNALRIARDHPQIGAFGGQLVPRFEREPADSQERSFGGERVLSVDLWSNIIDDNRTMPYGAGMCLRREVAEEYLRQVAADSRRLILGRTGNRFITGEDIDLNYVAVRMGLGTGLFVALRLIHLIPEARMTAAHIIRYTAGNAYSMVILQFLHFGRLNIPARSRVGALMFWLRVWLRMTRYERTREIAMHRARHQAVADMKSWKWI